MKRLILAALVLSTVLLAVPTGAQQHYQACPISANSTVVCKTGFGVFQAVVINKVGASANVATVYDALTATGTPIATIDTTAAVGTLVYNVIVRTGVTVVVGTGTAANLTVITD